MRGKPLTDKQLEEIRLNYIRLRSTRKLAEYYKMSKSWGGYIKAKYFKTLKGLNKYDRFK